METVLNKKSGELAYQLSGFLILSGKNYLSRMGFYEPNERLNKQHTQNQLTSCGMHNASLTSSPLSPSMVSMV